MPHRLLGFVQLLNLHEPWNRYVTSHSNSTFLMCSMWDFSLFCLLAEQLCPDMVNKNEHWCQTMKDKKVNKKLVKDTQPSNLSSTLRDTAKILRRRTPFKQSQKSKRCPQVRMSQLPSMSISATKHNCNRSVCCLSQKKQGVRSQINGSVSQAVKCSALTAKQG